MLSKFLPKLTQNFVNPLWSIFDLCLAFLLFCHPLLLSVNEIGKKDKDKSITKITNVKSKVPLQHKRLIWSPIYWPNQYCTQPTLTAKASELQLSLIQRLEQIGKGMATWNWWAGEITGILREMLSPHPFCD